jgi:hypothetical protein
VLLAVALIMISLSYDEVYARGNRESRSPELTVISEDGTLVNANTRVIATGSVSVVGNDPFTRLVLRTTAPDSSDRWILEIQGPLSEEIGRFYQHCGNSGRPISGKSVRFDEEMNSDRLVADQCNEGKDDTNADTTRDPGIAERRPHPEGDR